ncbi:NUMOD4 domain-containing protein [Chryseobacterium sp. JUb7]|uniref:NUMOD4 domain-containing protein n=1 Tax=Chryseobacterium sp. JUb7 TaxID=2940599 RepID=UPI0021684FC0|nr:NUMOD4 domain-containing protein [Chryseobacterium sp. JUb7]MCS3533126.1 hypothetical protein [Chryseobacterium sp. JUb7]
MKLPTEIKDKYLKSVLFNTSLKNLPGEEWKVIENFENYAISNYGRIKSLQRSVINAYGGIRNREEQIKLSHVFRYFNKYLKKHFYNVRCTLSSEGKKYGKSVARLVYYHFVESFNMDDKTFMISFKDDNRFHVHADNLEKLSVSDVHRKTLNSGRGNKGDYYQAVSQHTLQGNFVASFDSIYQASETLGIAHTYILSVIKKDRFSAGGFRWFVKDYIPLKQNFIKERKRTSNIIFNKNLWARLGKPRVNKKNPPACMNLSLKDMPGELWKPLPNFENEFCISSKGRIKRLYSWTENENTAFTHEKILSLYVDIYDKNSYYLYANLSYNGKPAQIRINRYLYYCFVKEFDLNSRSFIVVNKNNPPWDLDVAQLKLQSSSYHLNRIQ